MNDVTYEEWIQFLFNHVESEGDWRFEMDAITEDAEKVVAFTTRLFHNIEKDTAPYSDWQVALGTDYLFNNGFSSFPFYLRDGPAPLDKRLECIFSIRFLYGQCYAKRCLPVLGHLSEEGNPLNETCYMLWDITPLNYCEGQKDREAIYGALLPVLESSLYLSNIACIESGLHGLGHLVHYEPQAAEVIRKFIAQYSGENADLLHYAKCAETGCIQ